MSPIIIKVSSATDRDIDFKVKQNTRLGIVQAVYATKVGKRPDNLRFFFKGTRIQPNDTPAALGMKDADEITAEVGWIHLLTISNNAEVKIIKIGRHAKWGRLRGLYAKKVGKPVEFLVRDRPIQPDDTPARLGMVEGEVVEVKC